MEIKNEVLYRVYGVLFGLVLPIAAVLIYQTVKIGYLEGAKWRARGEELYLDYRPLAADRGNILARDGSLLATSIPFFDLYFDPNSTGMSERDFEHHIDSLSWYMANFVDNTFTPGGYKRYLIEQRKAGARYLPIKKKVTYTEKRFIESFPLFNLGRMRGGFIAKQRSERKRPFGLLAQRTIGYVRDGAKPVGLEGYFDRELGGYPGRQLMIKVDGANDIWIPVNDLTELEPESGDDILTTIDINLQDIVERALQRAMDYHAAEWGTAILMDVETGAIRAIANLGRTKGGWWETYNHAIGSAVEPGSTFKLASMMALLEDGYVDLQDSVDIERGTTRFYDEELTDSNPLSKRLRRISVKDAFKISSNVGISKLVNHYYGTVSEANDNEGAARFIRRLKGFNLHLPTGIEIEGEANPYIKEAYSREDQWSGTSLPWMSIGYEVKITPLQLLTFYNAVANGGRLMKPYLVSEIQRFGQQVRAFRPTVIDRQLASPQTIAQAQELLAAVVDDGTAYKLKTDRYRFAGKTGTAQINYRRGRNGNRIGGYQASFVGYFPADKPRFSCIVMINDPSRNGIYGGDVAGPVFREIADNCYQSLLELHPPYNRQGERPLAMNDLPTGSTGHTDDIRAVLGYLGIPFAGAPETPMGVLLRADQQLSLQRRSMPADRVPNVIGLGLRDALYILENQGLEVQVEGVGKVILQSLRPGTPVRGQTIALTLG